MKIRNQKSEIKNIKGFSLIELVFAMSFLTLIIFGVVSLQSSNLAMMGRQNNQIQANLHANQALQIVEALGYSAVHSAYNDCGAQQPCPKKLIINGGNYELAPNPPFKIGDVPFERTIEISPSYKAISLTNAYKVTTYIEWEDATGNHRRTDNAHVEAKQIIYKK